MENEEGNKVLIYCNNEQTAPAVGGSRKVAGNCGHTVWMSPATYELYVQLGDRADAKCDLCVPLETLAEMLEQERFMSTPAGEEELAREVGPELAAKTFADLKVKPMTEEQYDDLIGGAQ